MKSSTSAALLAVGWLEAQPADSVLAKQYLPGLKATSVKDDIIYSNPGR